ncbi:MAG TPA: hypothetical protein EYN86_00265 [Planctomycetes bacterium]|jgi:hypothetical protein|nr:hypothetical protein [Planctomycetota bacterium]
MILATFALVALAQQELAPQSSPPHQSQVSAKQWWGQLSDEQRQEYSKRQAIFDAEREQLLAEMGAEELEKFGEMGKREQRRYMRAAVRSRMDKSVTRPPRPPHLDLRQRESRIREALRQAHVDGWLGDKTATWLEQASVEEALQVLLSIRKWQFLEKANQEGFWLAQNIDLKEKQRLVAMPAEHFFREIQRIVSGRHKMWGGQRDMRRNQGPRKSSRER